ncbi:hypothetical protein ABK040_014915 [Willaertia magna]
MQDNQHSTTSIEYHPNSTIYINNINDKVKIPELKKELYSLFSQFGEILEIRAGKKQKTRGQAWIVFKDVTTATIAKKKMDGFAFHDKPFKIHFAKDKSDVTAELEGNLDEHKRKRTEEKKNRKEGEPEKKKIKQPSSVDTLKQPKEENEPNNILFLENLHKDVDKTPELIEMLFQNYDGFKRVRLIPDKGVGFVEYETIEQATLAKEALQLWRVKQQPLHISYAKK